MNAVTCWAVMQLRHEYDTHMDPLSGLISDSQPPIDTTSRYSHPIYSLKRINHKLFSFIIMPHFCIHSSISALQGFGGVCITFPLANYNPPTPRPGQLRGSSEGTRGINESECNRKDFYRILVLF